MTSINIPDELSKKNNLDISIIEKYIKSDPNLHQNLIKYIQDNIISYTVTDYSEHITSDDEDILFNELKYMFIKDGETITYNLLKILKKYITIKPFEFINIDNTNIWFANEPTFSNNISKNPFYEKKMMITIITIIFKLIDHINTFYINEIKTIDNRINYINHLIENAKINKNLLEFMMVSAHYNDIIKKLKEQKDKTEIFLTDFYNNTKVIRDYYLSLFNFINMSKQFNYLDHLSMIVLNIFEPSLIIGKDGDLIMDNDLIKFICDQYEWIPSSFRCKYLPKLLTLMKKPDINTELKSILQQFFPKKNLLIKDVNNIYKKYLKDPIYFSDLIFLISVLGQMLNYNLHEIEFVDTKELIYFVSVCITSIIKIIEEKDKIQNKTTYEYCLLDNLQCINYVLKNKQSSKDIIESYLVYQIPTTIITLQDQNIKSFSNYTKMNDTINEILYSICLNKLAIIYMANIISDVNNIKIDLSVENNKKLIKWINIYNKISDSIDDEDIIDPLTSSVIIFPCLIPMDNSDKTIVCDINMLCTYLWSKPENPFTRQNLSIDELTEFNKKDDIIDKVKLIIDKLRIAIKSCNN